MRPRFLTTLALFGAIAGSVPACSNSLGEDEDEGALIGGDLSGTEDDAVMLLVKDGKPLCTATLVAQNILITANHCVGLRGAQQRTGMVSTYEPGEITVRLGGTPGDKAAAVVTKIFTPRVATTPTPDTTTPTIADGGAPTQLADGGTAPAATNPAVPRGLESMDVAALLVQPLDANFDKVRPRQIRAQAIGETETVSVVGWNANSADARLTSMKRMKRTSVDVLADSTQQINVESPSLAGVSTVNKPREFVTEAVACQGDDGAPAFDAQGALAGFVAAVVGPCQAGSLSVFTDAFAHKSFLTSVLSEVQKLSCSSDAKCAQLAANQICDTRTFTCAEGCRVGSTACAGGRRCVSPSETAAGVAGTCSTSTAGTTYDGGTSYYGEEDGGSTYEPPPVLGDGGLGTSGTTCTDKECGGTTQAPKVCDAIRKQCVAGCRVGASPSMCGPGYDCKAGVEDPTIGTCQARAVAAPPSVALAPPARATEQVSDPNASTAVPDRESGDAGKKSKKNKATGGGGCNVGAMPAGGTLALAWLPFAALIAAGRRRRDD